MDYNPNQKIIIPKPTLNEWMAGWTYRQGQGPMLELGKAFSLHFFFPYKAVVPFKALFFLKILPALNTD